MWDQIRISRSSKYYTSSTQPIDWKNKITLKWFEKQERMLNKIDIDYADEIRNSLISWTSATRDQIEVVRKYVDK